MSHRQQAKYFEKLKKYEKKFDPKELSEYRMFVKRHKDDEDLDKISLAKLESLYEKYYVHRERDSFEGFFKSENQTDAE